MVSKLSIKNRERLRKSSIIGAQYYNRYLLDKTFVIITDDFQIHNVTFLKEDFNHLSGLEVNVGEEMFFDLCVNGTISWSNIKEKQYYDFNTLKKKGRILEKLNCFLHADVSTNLYLTDLRTYTGVSFPAAIRNDKEDITIAFKGADYHARSLRRARNSNLFKEQKLINAIFVKESNETFASTLIYIRNVKKVVENAIGIEKVISTHLLNKLNKSIK